MPTPAAVADIATKACRIMEVTPVSSLDDDSQLARDLLAEFEVARDRCLEAGDWSFASQLVLLPEYEPAAPFAADPDLPYSFRLPGDCLRVHEVGSLSTRWRVDRDALRADEPAPLRLRYTARTENEQQLPAEFRVAVATVLAAALAPQYVETLSKRQAIQQEAEAILKRAARNVARDASGQRYDGGDDEADWVASRTSLGRI